MRDAILKRDWLLVLGLFVMTLLVSAAFWACLLYTSERVVAYDALLRGLLPAVPEPAR